MCTAEIATKMNMNDTMNYYTADDSGCMTMMMQMSFYWGNDVTVMFEWWNTNGNTALYLLTLFVLFIIALTFEVFNVLSSKYKSNVKSTSDNNLLVNSAPEKASFVRRILLSLRTSIIYTLRFIIAYVLMLSIMTYNWGIAIAIFSGVFVGKTIFVFMGLEDTPTSDATGCH